MDKKPQQIVKEYDEELLQKKNVIGVGVGPKNGVGEQSVVILVEKKEDISTLDEGDVVPEEIEGVKTDVIETGPIRPMTSSEAFATSEGEAVANRKRVRPIYGGVSAIWKKGTACTLGAIVWKDGKPYALMNTHCGNPHWNGAKVGDEIIQPSGNDGGKKTGSKDVIGKSTSMFKELILDGKTPNKFDACLVEIDKGIDVKELYLEGIGDIKATPAMVKVGDEVTKSGRTTGVGSSKVLITNATVSVDYGDGIGIFTGQIISENANEHFTSGGDSSSLVIDQDRRPVGQIFAGSDTIAIFCPIQPIMDEYGFSFSEKPVTPEPFKFTRTLKIKDTGYEVKMLQEELKKRGFFPANVNTTEYFGTITRDSLQKFQCAMGLVCNGTPETTGYGQVGPKTRDILNGIASPKLPLYPILKQKRELLAEIMDATGNPIFVTDEYRSNAEQDALYAIGRTKPGKIVTNAKGGESMHNYRCAFDVAFVKKDGSDPYVGPWDMVGRIGKAIGLEWGGEWDNFVDRPHFQYTAGYTLADFQNGKIDEAKFGVIAPNSEVLKDDNNIDMSNDTKRHVKASAALVGAGVVVMPLLGSLLEGLLEVMNMPAYAAQIDAWFGAGSVAALLALTLSFRVVAWALNAIADWQNRNKGIASASSEGRGAVKI